MSAARDGALIAFAFAAVAGAVALLAWASGGVEGIEPAAVSEGSVADAGSILAANAFVFSLPLLAGAALLLTRGTGVESAVRIASDTGLALSLLLNAALAGAVIGTLGGRALERTLPHAGFELAGLGAAGALYLGIRRGERRVRGRNAVVCGAGLTLLVLGAAVESFVSGEL